MRRVLMALFAASGPPLVEMGRLELPGITGRIDHLAWDAKGERLFVAALGHGSVEVVHWPASPPPPAPRATPRAIGRIPSLASPQGVAYLPASDELVFTTGGDGKLHVHDATTLAEKKSFAVGGDADNVRVDEKAGLLYVGCEEGIAIVAVARWERVAVVELAGHAEGFQLERGADGTATRLFVNVPERKQVAVIDATTRKVAATWPIGDAASNYPMALGAFGSLDGTTPRLFVGCRSPACVLVLDPATGARLAKLPIGGDCDDLFVDSKRRRLVASCGSGVVSIHEWKEGDRFEPLADVPTPPGARTSLFLADDGTLFVAAPRREGGGCTLIRFATSSNP